jgi:hypothetical protein
MLEAYVDWSRARPMLSVIGVPRQKRAQMCFMDDVVRRRTMMRGALSSSAGSLCASRG